MTLAPFLHDLACRDWIPNPNLLDRTYQQYNILNHFEALRAVAAGLQSSQSQVKGDARTALKKYRHIDANYRDVNLTLAFDVLKLNKQPTEKKESFSVSFAGRDETVKIPTDIKERLMDDFPYFRAVWSSLFKEGPIDQDASPQFFQDMIGALYENKETIHTENVIRLLLFAHKIGMGTLRAKCFEFLKRQNAQSSLGNKEELIEFANESEIDGLLQLCQEICLESAAKAFKRYDWRYGQELFDRIKSIASTRLALPTPKRPIRSRILRQLFSRISSIQQLTEIDLSHQTHLLNTHLEMIGHMPQLTSLTVSDSEHLSHEFLRSVSSPIRYLAIINCRSFTSTDGIQKIATLKSLVLNGCDHLSDNALERLQLLPKLESLNIGWNPALYSYHLQAISRCPQLRFLSLACCPNLHSLYFLTQQSTIRILDLALNPHLTDQDLMPLKTMRPLKQVGLHGSTGLTASKGLPTKFPTHFEASGMTAKLLKGVYNTNFSALTHLLLTLAEKYEKKEIITQFEKMFGRELSKAIAKNSGWEIVNILNQYPTIRHLYLNIQSLDALSHSVSHLKELKHVVKITIYTDIDFDLFIPEQLPFNSTFITHESPSPHPEA